jgi:hypothetical protein
LIPAIRNRAGTADDSGFAGAKWYEVYLPIIKKSQHVGFELQKCLFGGSPLLEGAEGV